MQNPGNDSHDKMEEFSEGESLSVYGVVYKVCTGNKLFAQREGKSAKSCSSSAEVKPADSNFKILLFSFLYS